MSPSYEALLGGRMKATDGTKDGEGHTQAQLRELAAGRHEMRVYAVAPDLLSLVRTARQILEPMHDCDPAIREWLARLQKIEAHLSDETVSK